jgi:hypothetical protein
MADSWLQLPDPRLNDTDLFGSVSWDEGTGSELSSVLNWANMEPATTGKRAGDAAADPAGAEDTVPTFRTEISREGDVHRFDAPLTDGALLQTLRKEELGLKAPSLLDSILPIVPLADLSRIRACLSALSVAYRQQELSSIHLQATLRDSRAESRRLQTLVDNADVRIKEETERAGFLVHALQTLTGGEIDSTPPAAVLAAALDVQPAGVDGGTIAPAGSHLALSLAVLRGQALQRAAERISALTVALTAARGEIAALHTRESDTAAVTAAGYEAMKEQISRLTAELAQQSIIADAKVCACCGFRY